MSEASWKAEYRAPARELNGKQAVKQDLLEFAGFLPVNLSRHGLTEAPDVPLTRHLCHRGGMAPPEACGGCLVAKTQGGPCIDGGVGNYATLMAKLLIVRNVGRANRDLSLSKSRARQHYMESVNKSEKKHSDRILELQIEANKLNREV